METKISLGLLLLGSAAQANGVVLATVDGASSQTPFPWIPLITAVGVGSIVAAAVGWTSAKAVAISYHRQNWVNAIRDDIATFLKEVDVLHFIVGKILGESGGTTDDLQKQQDARASAMLVYRRIRMRLNMTESPSIDLARALKVLMTIESKVANTDHMEAVLTAAAVVFKQEWEVTKYGVIARPVVALKRVFGLIPRKEGRMAGSITPTEPKIDESRAGEDHLGKKDEEIAKAALDAYGYCTNILRAWFGAYSIGVPALVLSTDKLRQALLASKWNQAVLCCFAGAIALQVFLTFINKYTQYGVYERYGTSKTMNWFTKGSESISDWIWVDFIADVGTIIFLVVGSVMVFDIFALSTPK
jgi:hypothetical protein